MSEERPPSDDGTDGPPDDDADDRHLDTEETSGLGLTEEFARIEAEIGDAAGEQPEASGPAEGEAKAPRERTAARSSGRLPRATTRSGSSRATAR